MDLKAVKQLELKSNTPENNTPNYQLIFKKTESTPLVNQSPTAYVGAGNLNILFPEIESSKADIYVYNIYGQEVLKAANKKVDQGYIQLPFTAAAGQYIVRIVEGQTQTAIPVQVH